MKSLSKSMTVATGLIGLFMVAFTLTPAFADSPGQLQTGPIYRIKNITQNTGYANPQTANACDELEYSIQLHNSGYGGITNMNVSATLPGGASTTNTSNATITYDESTGGSGLGSPATASATLNISSAQSVSYVSGSTQLLNNTGAVIKALPDGVTQSGVNIGGVAGSSTEYVNFEVKVGCPVTPPPATYACTDWAITAEQLRFLTSQLPKLTVQPSRVLP